MATKKTTVKENAGKKRKEKPEIVTPEITVTRKRRIVFAGSEAAPFIATGGLADVLGSLPAELAKSEENEISVILPLYSKISGEYRKNFRFIGSFEVPLSWRRQYCGVFHYLYRNVNFYFIDNEYYFKRDGNIYGFYDDGERYAFFSKAILETIGHFMLWPDVLHCNDWQTAAAVIYLKSIYGNYERYKDIRTVFTIHNIEYQGKYGLDCMDDLFGFPGWVKDTVEFDGCINLMKGAIEMSDIVNTVSPTYAEEIKNAYFAHGLEGIISRNEGKLRGILNGIDYEYYNPQTDRYLFANYSPDHMEGKAVCKEALQKMLNLPVKDVPMIAVISRLVAHKGFDLVKAVIENVLNQDVQFVILGTGDRGYEAYFSQLANQYRGKCVAIIEFNQDLSRKIYAGADFFLMPSKMEPCGLSQMIASRYGTVAIVRGTGGLNDSIQPLYEGSGNGFSFRNYNAHDMLYVINQAIRTYYDKEAFLSLRARAMATDFSWAHSAGEYEEVYRKLI